MHTSPPSGPSEGAGSLTPSEGASIQSDDAGVQGKVRIVLAVVFLVFLGNTTVNPILAPLAREVGLAEWQIGATVSTAALMLVLTSQYWGRRSQSWGTLPVLLTAVGVASLALAAFAATAHFGIAGVIAPGVMFVLFLLFRGLLFGAAMAAVPPTAQAFIAEVTTGERERVKGMAGIGAAHGMAMISGAVVGGVLAGFGLMTPLVVIPLLVLLAFALVWWRLEPEQAADRIEIPAHIRPGDTRVWPYLVAGFGLFTALGFIIIITGFVVQDRLDLTGEQAGMATGGALLAVGLAQVLAQTVIVPRSGWSPRILLRVGSAVGTAGMILYAWDLGLAGVVVAVFFIGLGLGIAMPGYMAGPSLTMRRDEHGALAGLISATNGLTFVIAPVASTLMYGVAPSLPIMVGAGIMAAVTLFVIVHPRFRHEPDLTAHQVSAPDELGAPPA